jgi:hypothetical protein
VPNDVVVQQRRSRSPAAPSLRLYLRLLVSVRAVWPCQRRFDLVSPTGFEPALPP